MQWLGHEFWTWLRMIDMYQEKFVNDIGNIVKYNDIILWLLIVV